MTFFVKSWVTIDPKKGQKANTPKSQKMNGTQISKVHMKPCLKPSYLPQKFEFSEKLDGFEQISFF